MQPLAPAEIVRRLRRLGFDGPFGGGSHPWMQRGKQKVTVPNPHGSVISGALIQRMLRRAGLTAEEWEAVK
jgi:predicted RNA binding protein YcfA (HicA-like mRNA interferase family)